MKAVCDSESAFNKFRTESWREFEKEAVSSCKSDECKDDE